MVDAAGNGKLIWSATLSDYAPSNTPGPTKSRTSPAVVNGVLYIGTQAGAYVLAINAATGALMWKTQVEDLDPHAIVTTSPVVHNGVVYTGVASLAEGGSAFGFDILQDPRRGSVVALDAAPGAILWKTYMTPEGYTGAGIWGSNPVVDAARASLYVGTGNNYTHPTDPAYLDCIDDGGSREQCNSPDNYVDAIVALDLASGAIKWATKLVYWNQLFVRDGSDDWNVDCFFPSPQNPGPQCPSDPGPVAGGTPLHASDRRTVRGRLVGECGSRGIERDRVLGIRLYKSWSPRDRQ